MKVCGLGYRCNLVNCSSLPTVHRLLLTKCCKSSYLTLCCIVLQRTDWLMIMTEIKKTNSHFLPCRSCSNSIKVTWRLQLRCDAVFMTSSPSSSLRFSLLAVIFRTTLNKITSRRFQQHLQKALLCSGTYKKHLCVVESAFTFSFSPIPQLLQYHRPSARSKSLIPCSVKTPQYRVRKCVHEGKPRATNHSRVNPITVQCKVGNWHPICSTCVQGSYSLKVWKKISHFTAWKSGKNFLFCWYGKGIWSFDMHSDKFDKHCILMLLIRLNWLSSCELLY